MAKILFIINPIAGGGRAAKLVSSIEKLMESTRLEYSIVLTKKPKEASILSKQGLGQGYDRIIAVGGDGTVNEVALGIMEYGKGVLGIIPCGTGNDDQMIRIDGLTISALGRKMLIGDKSILLTGKEFDLLYLLASNPGKVYTREMLLKTIWGYEYFGDLRTVDVHIRRLREKIEKELNGVEYIHTRWGVGYYFSNKKMETATKMPNAGRVRAHGRFNRFNNY